MRVGVAGTGSVGLACAALLDANGHRPLLWATRGAADAGGQRHIQTIGLFEHSCTVPVVADVAEFATVDVVIICVLGNGHRAVFEAIAPVLRSGQSVIISSHASLGALYLSRLIAMRGLDIPIVAWATTLTGGPKIDGQPHVRLLRRELDVATLPATRLEHGLSLSRALFPATFNSSATMLGIALGNLNPPIHMANAMLNFTRIEKAESWSNYGCITHGVGSLIEALDAERLATAAAFGERVRSARDHYLRSFADLVPGRIDEMSAQVDRRRKGTAPGPTSPATRYITEDLPFGIFPVAMLGRLAGVDMRVHEAGLTLMSAVYGRDLATDNDLLPKIGLDRMDAPLLRAVVTEGWTASLLARMK